MLKKMPLVLRVRSEVLIDIAGRRITAFMEARTMIAGLEGVYFSQLWERYVDYYLSSSLSSRKKHTSRAHQAKRQLDP